MRVVIIGAGNAGRRLAAKLGDEKHDIIIIDPKSEPLAEIESQLDVLTVQGSGSNPCILDEAGIHKAELFVAVSDRDEVNILACLYAHNVGVPYTVARVSSMDYIETSELYDLHKMGISLVVSQQDECAQELFNILRMPGTKDVVDMLDGRILAAGIQVHIDSPLIRSPLADFPDKELIQTIRFIGYMRGDEPAIPKGDTQFMIGDVIYVVGEPQNVTDFLQWAEPEHGKFDKIIVAGGGSLGVRLAKHLETLPTQVVLIESDEVRAHTCSESLDKALVMKGDLLDPETLDNAGIIKNTAFVALTNDDENNIISCLLAEKKKASFTLAQVNKPDYVPIINNLSLLDRVISSHLSLINAILHFVRGKHVREATLLQNLPGELLDVVMPPESKWVGKPIKSVKLPSGSIIATVVRGDEVFTATGDLTLEEGDRLVMFSLPAAVSKLEATFRRQNGH